MNSEQRPVDPTIASMMDTISKMSQENARVAAEAKAAEIAYREQEERFAERAREGELGPEWEKLQKRIDAGETTRQRILSGEDSSPEAHVIQQTLRRNLTKMRQAWEEEREEGRENILDDLDRLRGALQRGPAQSFPTDTDSPTDTEGLPS